MTDANVPAPAAPSLAIVGLACRFPDSDDPAALLEAVLTGRRSFRRLPPGRIDLADYYQPDLATSDATYSTRAALIEGWQFDCAAFGIDPAAYISADPAHWLALETTARALAAAGLPGGRGLIRDRTGVIIGNTLAGDTSRANALRVRWPYVRHVLTDALDAVEIPAGQAGSVLSKAESGYLAPFPAMGPDSLAGSMPATIAGGISSYFGFRGGSHAIDSACSSSLQAVASACAALAAGELDAAIAGGVDLSLDPLELIGLARAGLLATRDVRIYDQNPTGYLPGEGCGVVVLLRAADAQAAGLPVYAEIVGWGTSAGATPGEPHSQASSHLLAMRRAYDRSGVDPADIHYLEGNGAGTAADDQAELSALALLRSGAKRQASLGSVKANIGHAKAAAGAAGLIKTVLALGTGVVPPTTGSYQAHSLITDGSTRLELPQVPQDWEEGTRLAAVSTMGIGGSNVHLVLRHEPPGRVRQDKGLRSMPLLARAAKSVPSDPQPCLTAAPQAMAFLLHAPDRHTLSTVLSRLADVAGWLSDAEMQDLACMLGRDTLTQGPVRVALVATRQEQLSVLAREAATMLPRLTEGLLSVRPGIFAADKPDGRVTLLLSGNMESALPAAAEPVPAMASAAHLTWAVTRCLDTLRWLDSLDVHASTAVGHGLGALPGLAWAGVLGESDVIEIAELRAQFIRRSGGAAATVADSQTEAKPSAPATGTAATRKAVSPNSDVVALRAAIGQRFRFGPPRRRLLSTMTGAEISSVAEAIDLICSGFAESDKLQEAVGTGAVGATLLFETGPGRTLVNAAAGVSRVPAISLQSGYTDPLYAARASAALFAAGALGDPQALFAGRPARPISIWREQVFITNPCQLPSQPVPAPTTAGNGSGAEAATQEAPADGQEPTRPRDHGPTSDAAAAVLEMRTAPVRDTMPAPGAEASSAPAGSDARDGDTAYEDDGISSLRAEFERGRLPARPLTRAATSRAVPSAGSAAPAEPAEPAVPAESPNAAEPSVLAQPATAAEPSVSAQPATAAEPSVSAQPATAAAPPAIEEDSASEPAILPEPARKDAAAAAPESAPAADDDAGNEAAVPSSPATRPVPGVRPWVRCFTEGQRPVRRPASARVHQARRVHAAARNPALAELSSLFTSDPEAASTLAIVEDPADERSRAAAIEAARDGITTGELVVLTTSPDFTGFFASVHAEHPATGVTVLRVSAEGACHDAVSQFGYAEPGRFRELIVSPAGTVTEPVLAEVALPGGAAVPFGPDDVVLVSRDTRGAGLALAQVLVCCGAGVAVIGRTAESDDSELVAGLEQLRSAGSRVGYEVVDVADPASLTAAVKRIEDRLGPVTAIAHAVGPDDPVSFSGITGGQASEYVSATAGTLDRLASAVRADQLKLILTFGSVIGRYGLAGASLYALSRAAMASQAGKLGGASLGCRTLHIDLPAWSTAGLGERPELATELAAADTPPIDVITVSRLLLKIMTTAILPPRLAVHGRIGRLASRHDPVVTRAELAAAGLPQGGRFLREAVVHYPGIELVCGARLSLRSDPYLTDYRIDGMPVLPPVLALEALAQAASVLAGQPVRRATSLVMESPIVVPSRREAVLRVCALRDGNSITAVLRCADSSYRADHVRAEFAVGGELQEMPQAGIAAASTALQQVVAGPSGLVDGAELYGPICFQSGRFRRIALLPEVTARSGRALARAADNLPWFAADSDAAASGLLLGSPGLNDTALQVLQACVPHRRVRLAGCESVQFSGRDAEGPVEIRAIAEPVRPAGALGRGDRLISGQVGALYVGKLSDPARVRAKPRHAAPPDGNRASAASEGNRAPADARGNGAPVDGSGIGASVDSSGIGAPATVTGVATAADARGNGASADRGGTAGSAAGRVAGPRPTGTGNGPTAAVGAGVDAAVKPGSASPSEEPSAKDLAESETAERTRQSRKSRRAKKAPNPGRRDPHEIAYSAFHTWEVSVEELRAKPKPAEQPTSEEPAARPISASSAGAPPAGAAPASAPPAGAAPAGAAQASRAQAGATDAVRTDDQHHTVKRADAGTPAGSAGPAAAPPRAGTAAGSAISPHRIPVPQLWDVEAVDATGQLLAAWRGVRLRDSGPLPRNSAWPPTLLSVYLERSAAELGLDESLRVNVTCGQPHVSEPQVLDAIPPPSPSADASVQFSGWRTRRGRHAHPLSTATAPGLGTLSGFGLTVRALVPVACAWTAAESAHVRHEPSPGFAPVFAQLCTALAEPPALVAARLDAVATCLVMTDLSIDDQLSVTRTTNDGWALFETDNVQIGCAVVEVSGVAAPVAIAMLTLQSARHGSRPGTAPMLPHGREPAQLGGH